MPTAQGRFHLPVLLSLTRGANTEVARAAAILEKMGAAHENQTGAIGLELHGREQEKEMIDAPMIKQVRRVCSYSWSRLQSENTQAKNTLKAAVAAGMDIPLSAPLREL